MSTHVSVKMSCVGKIIGHGRTHIDDFVNNEFSANILYYNYKTQISLA